MLLTDRNFQQSGRLLAALTLLMGVLAGCVSSQNELSLQRFEYEQPQMGVPFRIVLYAASPELAQRAVEAAFKRIAELNAVLSDYETDSEVSTLSRTSEEGSPSTKVSEDLWNLLSASQRLARETGGAFDITVGPCVTLWRKARRQEELPDAKRLESARQKVGFENLVLDEKAHAARLLRRGMRLDLGGIAKGYAADEAMKTLRSFGINRALVAASGDLAIGDAPPGEAGWRVEIAGYQGPGAVPALVTRLRNRGVSTSGDLFQFVEIDGIRYSHILDPFTCVGMTNRALATVIAPTCTASDALATICTMLPPREASDLVKSYKAEMRAIVLAGDSPRITRTPGFPNP